MTNLKGIPAQDDFETTLSATYNGGVGSMGVFHVPDSTLPTGEYTYAVIEPGTQNMQVVKISGWTSSPKAFIVSDVAVEKANNVNYTATTHPANSTVRISNNYQFWKDIKTAINSKADPSILGDYSFSGNEISVIGDVAQITASGADITLSTNGTMKLKDKNVGPISIEQMIHPAGSGSEIIVEAEDDYDSGTATVNTAYFTYKDVGTITNLHYNGVDYTIGISGSLAEPTNLEVTTSGTTATITWTDPDDLKTIPAIAFAKSVLVRKVGSVPTSPSDGTVVVEETTRNQYKTTGYSDTGLIRLTDYYYRVFTYSTTGVISYGDGVNAERERTYTITFTETSSPSGFNPTYSDDAAGLTVGSTDFDKFFGYSAVRLSTAGVETAEITQEQSGGNGKLDITQLGTLTSGDNVMIKFPVRGIKMSKSGSTVTLSITERTGRESDGYQYYAFQKTGDIEANAGATVETSPLYLGTYLSYTDGTTLKSWSGKTPQGNYTMGDAITYAGNNGTGYTISGWYQRQLINAYYMMKYGNSDSQTVVGRGFVDGNNAATATGGTDSQLNATYGTSSGQDQIKLFGLEDWRGNQHQRVGGMFTDGSKNMRVALHDFTASISTAETQYKDAGTIYHTGSSYDISEILGTNKGMLAPIATVNNSNYDTYWCDNGSVTASRLAISGGHWAFGSAAGAFRLGVDQTGSSKNADVGTRLMFL